MRKIRIGNDIRLKLKIKTLRDAGTDLESSGFVNYNWDTIDEFDQSNIKQLRCYLINTSFCKHCHDHEHRKFQRVGFPDFYHPTAHNINNAGFSSYHMAPANMCNYDKFSPDFHDFHWWPGYRGFGIYPEHFHEYCGHMHWHGTKPSHFYPHCHNHHEPFFHGYDHHGIEHCKPEPFDQWLHPEYVPQDIFGKENVILNHPHPYQPYYLADSQVLNETNTLTCMFPAVQQKMCGTYKLVVVLTVFEQGWGRHNLRTYTIDKGEVFELVDTSNGESGAITIDTDSTGEKEGVIQQLYTDSDLYILPENKDLPVGEIDSVGKTYNIRAILKDGTKAIYNPLDWRYDKLIFESADETRLTIDQDGTIHTHTINDVEEVVWVSVKSQCHIEGEDAASFNFRVLIRKMNIVKMGFSLSSESTEVSPNDSWVETKDADAKSFVINNGEDGKYLWIFSQRKIHYIKSVEEGEDKVSELSSGFRVPTIDCGIVGGYFCYRSTAQILSGTTRIKIVFA